MIVGVSSELPSSIKRKRMASVDYLGYDPNPLYIQDAKLHYPTQGKFICGYLEHLSAEDEGRFDLVLANGVLHHMNDAEAGEMLKLAWQALKPGGRIVT